MRGGQSGPDSDNSSAQSVNFYRSRFHCSYTSLSPLSHPSLFRNIRVPFFRTQSSRTAGSNSKQGPKLISQSFSTRHCHQALVKKRKNTDQGGPHRAKLLDPGRDGNRGKCDRRNAPRFGTRDESWSILSFTFEREKNLSCALPFCRSLCHAAAGAATAARVFHLMCANFIYFL